MNIDSLDTIERFIPQKDIGASWFYEHLIRYLFASQLTKDKIVLDAACGVGYGSMIMSFYGKAKHVYGVDISKSAIKYADRYSQPNNTFKVDSVLELSTIKDKSIDVAVSFELIEHIHEQDIFLGQIRRVLKDDGIFIISTPNKDIYSKYTANQFHVHELTYEEFDTMLHKYFKYTQNYYQTFELSAVIKSENETGEAFNLIESFSEADKTTYTPILKKENSQYVISVCSNKKMNYIKTMAMNTSKVAAFDLTHGLFSTIPFLQKLYSQNY